VTAARTSEHPSVTPLSEYEPGVYEPGAGEMPPAPTSSEPRQRLQNPVPLRSVPAAAPPSPHLRAAAAFADAAMRAVLEVIDRRRSPAQLRSLMPAGLADAVGVFVDRAPAVRAAAVLRSTRVQPCDQSERAFEVSATFSRHTRWHAVACRIERRDTRWQVVALHIG
jgi:hypothetical protein